MPSVPRPRRGPWKVRARADRRRPGRGLPPTVEPLEGRQLLSASSVAGPSAAFQPTAGEQYLLELVNRARANPAAEGARLYSLAQTDPVLKSATSGWDLNPFLALISSYAPQAPLAFNTRLIEAARGRNAVMLATNSQNHSPPGYLTNTQVARASDGQVFYPTDGSASWSTGENIYAYSQSVRSTDPAAYAEYFAASFLLDWGNPRYGHLKNTLAPGPGGRVPGASHSPYSEIGIGLLTGVTPTVPPGAGSALASSLGINVGPALVTEEFAYRSGNAFLTGSFSLDADNNRFYTPGEGLSGVSVVAVGLGGQGVFETRTWNAGGYSLPLSPGRYVVSAAGGGLPNVVSAVVTVGVDNVAWSFGATVKVADTPVPADYNGDGKAELAVYRASTAQWFVDGQAAPIGFGGPGLDTPLPGDYDGVGRAEMALYRPSTGQWFVLGPDGGKALGTLGVPGDVPVPGDYDGLGHLEPAVYRPSTAQWFVLGPNGVRALASFGAPGLDVPVPGDYDGLGRAEVAVYRPTTAQWFVNGPEGGRLLTTLGRPNLDVPVPGNHDGPGRFEPAVYRPTTGDWFVLGPNGRRTFQFGIPNIDVPVRADFDGNGTTDPAVFRTTTGDWYSRLSGGGTIARAFGQGGTTPPIPTGVNRHARVALPTTTEPRVAPLAEAAGSNVSTRKPHTKPASAVAAPPPPPRRSSPRWWEPLTEPRRSARA